MKLDKICLSILMVGFSLTIGNSQKKLKSIMEDFRLLNGSWQGSLTYLDYTTGKPYTMPADIEVKQIDKTNKFIFSYIYPDERDANSADTISISADGKYIEKEKVKYRKKLAKGDLLYVTEEKGIDGNDKKKATFRYTYTIGQNTYVKRKDVRYMGDKNWIKRHEYSFTRKSI